MAGASTGAVPPPEPVPSQDPSTISPESNNDTNTDQSVKKSSLLNVPSRTSSSQKLEASMQSTESTSPPVQNSDDEPRRGSRRAIMTRSRNNSRGSKRSLRAAARNLQASKEPVPPLPQHDGTRSEKKAKSGGFLAFLNCCSSGVDDKDDGNLPAVKPKIQPASRVPQKVAEKPTISEGDKGAQQETLMNEKDSLPAAAETGKGAAADPVSQQVSRPQIRRDEETEERIGPGLGLGAAAVATGAAGLAADQHRTDSSAAVSENVEQQPPKPDTEASRIQKDDLSWLRPGDNRADQDTAMPDAEEAEVPQKAAPEPTDREPKYEAAPLQSESIITQVPQTGLPPPPPIVPPPQQFAGRDEKQTWLLPPLSSNLQGRKCLVLDLDETLVHSSFKILNQADFTIPVEIEGQFHNVYVIKRPGVDQFMKRVGELYEVVVFTASVSKYGDPLLDQLDIHHVVHHRLFRESCYNHQGNYVKVSMTDLQCDPLTWDRTFLK